MSELENLAKQRIPLIYFVPVRLLLGISWIWFFIQAVFFQPPAVQQALLGWAVGALIAGVLLFLGFFTKLGAFISVLLAYEAYFSFSVTTFGFSTNAFTLLFVSIALLYWKVGRVLGIDKYLVGKLPPLLEKILI